MTDEPTPMWLMPRYYMTDDWKKLLKPGLLEDLMALDGVTGMYSDKPCPRCKYNDCHLLSTTNEWKNYCPKCDTRFNDAGYEMPKLVRE